MSAKKVYSDWATINLNASASTAWFGVEEVDEVAFLLECGTVGGSGTPALKVEGTMDSGTTAYTIPMVEHDGAPTISNGYTLTTNLSKAFQVGAVGTSYGVTLIPAQWIRFTYTKGTDTTGSLNISLVTSGMD